LTVKQLLQSNKTGEMRIEEVPTPALRAGGILVRSCFSLISAGTERKKVDMARSSLLGKARQRPDLVRQVIRKARAEGIGQTLEKVRNRLDTPDPLGYSLSGVVIDVAPDVSGVRPGDPVACAGAGYANHAEAVWVPTNLAVPVPVGVSMEAAAFTTVGAIALQGVRQAAPTLGEWVAVIGLGLVGQLAVQLLKANGCRVVAIDLDPKKVELAESLGADLGLVRGAQDELQTVHEATDGYGVDAALVAAAAKSSDPVVLAGDLCRDRGRIVVLGMVSLDVPWNDFYHKELEIRLSRSYGPGRYDPSYEEGGNDYPIGYVRWTENRNMAEFLHFVATGKVRVEPLITHRFPLAAATDAYAILAGERKEPYLGILLQYPESPHLPSRVSLRSMGGLGDDSSRPVRAGFIGAGNFAKTMLLPRLKDNPSVALTGVATATGSSAKHVASRFGFDFCTSDYRELLDDPRTNTVFIATRHRSHARLAREGLERGKAVFVEKPLAMNLDELGEVLAAAREPGARLMVGFNRRFSPLVGFLREALSRCSAPPAMVYRVNAGPLPRDHWFRDPQEGGRLLGEGCHFIDLLLYLAGSRPETVHAVSLGKEAGVTVDTFAVTLTFENGAIGQVLYAGNGDPSFPKERLELFAGGTAAVLDDFRQATITHNGKSRRSQLPRQDKGHAEELRRFTDALRTGGPMPIRLEELALTSLVSILAVRSIQNGLPERVDLDEAGIRCSVFGVRTEDTTEHRTPNTEYRIPGA
jgi:predicted dehydrogenase/threonine dehydrogenase-like Zn-dependent dehydrogenase